MDGIDQVRGLLGIAVFISLAWVLSTNRRRVNWRLVVVGLSLQFAFALLCLKTEVGQRFFKGVNQVFVALIGFTQAGASFVFGNLTQFTVPVNVVSDGGQNWSNVEMVASTGAMFAFGVLPSIIFFASLMAIFYHIGFMQFIIRGIAWVMFRLMRTSGAESLSAAANIFVGQTEAPLVVRPFLPKMTKSELMAIMTGGMATVAGGVMLAYIGFLKDIIPNIAGHLLAASIMSAPAGLVVAKIMVPETDEPETMGTLKVGIERQDVNMIGAAARGANEGLQLALNVGAMLIAFLALLALADGILDPIGRWWFDIGEYQRGTTGALILSDAGNPMRVLDAIGNPAQPLSLSLIFGYIFWPLAWVMGVASQDCMQMGNLLGLKTFANEFVAYAELANVGAAMKPRSAIIGTYALCGFANFSSIGILLGGIGPLAPERRNDLASLGLRALIAGTIGCFLTACIAGMLLGEGDLILNVTTP